MQSLLSRLGIALVVLLCAARSAEAARVTVPVDVGAGPAVHLLNGRVFDDQPLHFGLKFSVQAIIDKRTIQRNNNRIPKDYRKAALALDEARISPSIFIPDTLFISPKVRNTGLYGVSWTPVGMDLPLFGKPGDVIRAGLSGELLLTAAFLHSDVLPTTFFLRPGAGVGAHIELQFTKTFLMSVGWTSGFYVPQELGGFGLGNLDALDHSIWHVGQGWLKFHVRFPYTTSF